MSLADKIRSVMETRKLTQLALAIRLGVHPSSIANYLYGQRTPDATACLLLAGLCDSTEDKAFFVGLSSLTQDQIQLIAAGISGYLPEAERNSMPVKQRRAR